MEISAFGFRSANNFPHLDPKEVRVTVREEGEEPYEASHITDLGFQNRYQTKNYIKLNPWEKIKKIKFTFYKQRAQDQMFEMQLS